MLGWPVPPELSPGTEGCTKRKDRNPNTSDKSHSYFKPQGPYPVILFLLKFFFKFPNFPLEALDVLGELGNGLRLLAITAAAPRGTPGPAMIKGRGGIVKNNVFQ